MSSLHKKYFCKNYRCIWCHVKFYSSIDKKQKQKKIFFQINQDSNKYQFYFYYYPPPQSCLKTGVTFLHPVFTHQHSQLVGVRTNYENNCFLVTLIGHLK